MKIEIQLLQWSPISALRMFNTILQHLQPIPNKTAVSTVTKSIRHSDSGYIALGMIYILLLATQMPFFQPLHKNI